MAMRRRRGGAEEDADVCDERKRVDAAMEQRQNDGAIQHGAGGGGGAFTLLVHGFSKVYASQRKSGRLVSDLVVQILFAVAGLYIAVALMTSDAIVVVLVPPVVLACITLSLTCCVCGCSCSCKTAKRGRYHRLQTISSRTDDGDGGDDGDVGDDGDDGDDDSAGDGDGDGAGGIHAMPTNPKNGKDGGGVAAVSNMSFGIRPGECFGLLGVNGAGKTTLFKGLTGAIEPTSGSIEIGGHDVEANLPSALGMVGYCPQFDALCNFLTGKEHLEMYGRLYGIPLEQLPREVRKRLNALGLDKFENRAAGEYSYGNRRKLSLAIAMLGKRPVSVIREPP